MKEITKVEPVKLKVIIEYEIAVQRINDLLCCAIEGGSNYWIEQCTDLTYPEGKTRADFEFPYLEVPMCGGSYMVKPLEGDKPAKLDRGAIERGLKLLAEKYPKDWGDFMNENEDAITGDVFLQLALFGEVVYG